MTADTRSTPRLHDDPLVRGLGWASALLGVPQVAAPAGFARALGVGDAPGTGRPRPQSACANWRRRPGCWDGRIPSGSGAVSAATSWI